MLTSTADASRPVEKVAHSTPTGQANALYYKGNQGRHLMVFENFEMSDDQRIDIVEGLLDHVVALHNAFVEADEDDNAACLYAEFEEWFEEGDKENGAYEVMWAPNFTLIN